MRHAVAEGLEMLESEHRGRHEHSHLLRVASRLECSSHSHFRLSESHIATDEAVHRACALHVGFHFSRRLHLVGGVLIEERALQFILQIAVFRECEALLMTSLGIELDEVAGNILDALLGAFLQSVPSTSAESGETWRFASVTTTVFGDFI